MAETPPTQRPPPQSIFLVRHGEKPEAPTDTGVDASGAPNPACLTSRGWQRAAGLATLFDTNRAGLAVPTHLYSPDYPHHDGDHRTYETLLPLSQKLGLTISTHFSEGQEAHLATSILASDSGVSLVCWEHSRIPDIAAHIPVATGVVVPPRCGPVTASTSSGASPWPPVTMPPTTSPLCLSCSCRATPQPDRQHLRPRCCATASIWSKSGSS